MKNQESNIHFENVLVTDGMARTFFWLAQAEGLLTSTNGDHVPGRSPTPKERQEILSLVVLFEKLVIHQLTLTTGHFRVPDLERDQVLEVASTGASEAKIKPLRSSWKPTGDDRRARAPVPLRRTLTSLRMYKPLIVERLVSVRNDFNVFTARQLGITTRAFVSDFLDWSINYVSGKHNLCEQSIIEQAFPTDFVKELKRELFDFESRSDAGEEVLSATNSTLVMALLFAEELVAIQQLSAIRGLGVATNHYLNRRLNDSDGHTAFGTDPSHVPQSFAVVRSVLHEEGHFFPEIKNLAHALKLRKNPYIRSFREQLKEFHRQLSLGNRDGVEEVREEVRRAKKDLHRAGSITKALRWITYLSLPAGLAEGLIIGAPIVGTTLGILSVAGTAVSTKASHKNEWVLFGM
jgi:hypothetical protein